MQISYFEEIKRKAVHLSSLWMVVFTLLMAEWQYISCLLFFLLLLLTLVSEHSYANGGKYLGKLYGKLFGKMLRQEVQKGQWIVSGGAPVLAAALMVNIFFPPLVAASSLAVMLAGDAFAALIGRRYGRHKWVNGKSMEGTFSFVAAGFLAVCVIFLFAKMPAVLYVWGFFAVLTGSLVELFQKQLKLDDNFTIPLSVGIILSLAFYIRGY